MNYEEHERTTRALVRICLRSSGDSPELERSGGCLRLSGPSQGDAAAKVDEDRGRDGGGSSRARAGEQWHEEEDGERSG